MTDPNAPREYPVLRQPPRDFFTPIAGPIAGLLYVIVFIAILCFIGFGAHNMASRAPAMVQPPTTSTYARDYRASPTIDLSDTKLNSVKIPVRNRDRDNLRRHLHQHITTHGGKLVHAQLQADGPAPPKVDEPGDVPRDRQIYHVNQQYLDLVHHLHKPPWDNPTYYAQWAVSQAETPAANLTTPDAYIAVSTRYLWFENTRVRFLTNTITGAITGALTLAVCLTIVSAICQERSRTYRR